MTSGLAGHVSLGAALGLHETSCGKQVAPR